jgi:tripartite-type tricarboxylate transporter receptor subunit TctC
VKRLARLLLSRYLLAALMFGCACVQAQTVPAFPAKPIRLVVPFAPGGSTDILARILSRHMYAQSGQAMVVENVAGAGGNIGANQVAKAAPDGYTIEIGSVTTHAMNGSLY